MHRVNVLITVDVECWPQVDHPLGENIGNEISHHIYGRTRSGEELGINWQMDVLNQHGLRGVFFVESLCAMRGFAQSLREVVRSILSNGHDVELHTHTEWFGFPPVKSLVGNKCAQNLKDYSLDEQVSILTIAKQHLENCGADNVVAFRAGNFGADNNTLRACNIVGLPVDSSYNPVYVGRDCGLMFPQTRSQPFRVEGVWEFPVTCFRDHPLFQRSHLRPLQITATLFQEMSTVLHQASRHRMHTVVILTHSFEMTHLSSSPLGPKKHSLNAYRFRRLCSFLEKHSDLFRVTTFKEMVKHSLLPVETFVGEELIQSTTTNYLLRGIQNLSSAIFKY